MTTLDHLSPRERDVFNLIVAGKKPKEIATRLGIDVKTVSTYRSRLVEKLGVKTDAQLATLHAQGALALAADHALIAAALCAKVARWEPFSDDPRVGEVCTGGLRYCTSLDDHGVPILTNPARDAIRIAMPIRTRRAA